MDRFIAPVDARSSRIKRRILAENGIHTRHYALDTEGRTLVSNAQMAANAVSNALAKARLSSTDIDFLAAGTTGADVPAPGFANQIQGLLKAPPMATLSVQGICAAGISALRAAAHAIEIGDAGSAAVIGSDFPSRLFKRSRYTRAGERAGFDAHFLRWMLSDGAGAAVLARSPRPVPGQATGIAIRLRWIHTKSFSGDLPACMSIGTPENAPLDSYLDYASLAEAEADGAFVLRQDLRLLPNLFDLGIGELMALTRAGLVDARKVDHFLCHYSSEKFRGVVRELLENADAAIPEERWYSNLKTRGNTGAASMFIMLDEFLETTSVQPGQQILCFVPESGRFTVAFMLFEAVEIGTPSEVHSDEAGFLGLAEAETPAPLASLLRELNAVWHEYRSRVFRSPFAYRVLEGRITSAEYVTWMENWIPQVRVGSIWMREAIRNLPESLRPLGALIEQHATEEQFDFKILYQDYRALGGPRDIDELTRNPGGEALNAFMMATARSAHSFSLLGGTYIIEGTGQRIIPTLLPRLRQSLGPGVSAYRFLQYHGENDVQHMQRWLQCLRLVLAAEPRASERIVATARAVAELYALQWESIGI